jgi:hypothetical protein
MDARLKEWKLVVDRLWSSAAPDYAQAARLAAGIARSEEPRLAGAAAQAVASLRSASLRDADRGATSLARRRLGAVRDVLHALTAPRFGKRGTELPTPQEHYRHLLGLPLGRRLFGPEINQAYKRAAKRVHPDAGGSEREFLELSKARDALMRDV